MANPDDEDDETLEEWQRRIAIDNARKAGALIDEKGQPLKPDRDDDPKKV